MHAEILKMIEDADNEDLKRRKGIQPRRRTPKAQPAKKPNQDPRIRAAILQLTRKLIAANPEERVRAVAAIRSVPQFVPLVADALVEALRVRTESKRSGIIASLVEIGRDALPAIRLALLKAKMGWQLAALASVLAQIAISLPQCEAVRLQFDLDAVLVRSSPEALEAIDTAFTGILASVKREPSH